MVIQIRIVIQVPAEDEARFPEAIERIVDTVNEQFPALQVFKLHSPVTITIERFDEVKAN